MENEKTKKKRGREERKKIEKKSASDGNALKRDFVSN